MLGYNFISCLKLSIFGFAGIKGHLFALVQSTAHFKSLLMYLFIFFGDLSISTKLVSSAK